jgi:indolepyruvate ferredoxin oxidoreductase alpha subunit
VAVAAKLCPSFYRADRVHNPTGFERFLATLRGRIISWMQARREARRLVFE